MKRFLLFVFSTVLLLSATSWAQPTSSVRLVPYITNGLNSPLFMTSPRDGSGRLFIVQQGGVIRVVQPGSTTPTEFLNITSRVLSGGERGLLGLAFHPQYSTNRRFFVYYTRQTDGAIQIAEYLTSEASPNVANTTEKIIITIPHPTFGNHNGGSVAFGPDGYIYAGTGDGGSGNDPNNNAQNINQLLGKFIRLDIDNVPAGQTPQYNIPPGNPFINAPGADEIFALGMRNPYRFSFDRGGTRQLWAADVGQNVWEEVDIITLGGNYGWRIYEGNHCTNIDGCGLPANYVAPVLEYNHGGGRCSITGGNVYRGTRGTFAAGSYIYGDYCSGEIFLWNGTSQSVLLDTARNIVGFAEDESGELYLIGQAGTIERIASTQITVAGVVTTPDGRGLVNASVYIRDTAGQVRRVTTSSFGFYSFDNVSVGQTYTVGVMSRRYRFAARSVTVSDSLGDVNFVGLE
ncbi:MAG: PQQ-dependent sugar dehydrogenase [Pyrinomonadaceae bacterium]